MSRQRVVVLAGGLSHERDVSLRSGRRVCRGDAVGRGRGIRARRRRRLMDWLRREQPDCVIPLLHGEAGEDGALREILELAGVAYVGATPAAARVAFDKPIAKQVVAQRGRRAHRPRSHCRPTHSARSARRAVMARGGRPARAAACGQARQGRLSAGFSVVRDADELPSAMVPASPTVRWPSSSSSSTVSRSPCRCSSLDGVTHGVPGGRDPPRRRRLRLHRALHRGRRPSSSCPPALDADVAAECARVAETAHARWACVTSPDPT